MADQDLARIAGLLGPGLQQADQGCVVARCLLRLAERRCYVYIKSLADLRLKTPRVWPSLREIRDDARCSLGRNGRRDRLQEHLDVERRQTCGVIASVGRIFAE